MANSDGPIRIDRSRIEARKLCTRKRYLGYDRDGTGYALDGNKYEAEFGQILHTVMSDVLNGDEVNTALSQNYGDISTAVLTHLPVYTDYTIREQQWLLWALVRQWVHHRLNNIRANYKLVSTEVEHLVTFDPRQYLPEQLAGSMRPIELMFRPDAVFEREDGVLFVMDFKTTIRGSDDWALHHERSLQTYVYTEAMKVLHPDRQFGGVWYEGLVKGYRELDTAKSSKWQGEVIQRCPLYGWEKNGELCDYKPGAQRAFVPEYFRYDPPHTWQHIAQQPANLWLVNTIPSNPYDSSNIIGQIIVNENTYRYDMDMVESWPRGSYNRDVYENIMMEQDFHACYKYGSKHPCEFVQWCHSGLDEEAKMQVYKPRVPHHDNEHTGE